MITQQVYARLNQKYQSQFNFCFAKCVNQIVFNETAAPSTISFKDGAIYAQAIEYLKRQYYIINEIGIQQIFERIGMLAGFYSSAVLLRFEYPMMIVTRTKEIFLKRLKRNKKMITEEGSSDESKTDTLSRSVELHTNTFLDQVNSNQLSKKTAQLRDDLFPQFRQKKNQDKSFDPSIHDIHNPLTSFNNLIIQNMESVSPQESFADKLMKLSKNISLSEMVNYETVEVNLAPVENEIAHMIWDFDEIDKQLTILNYQKLKSKEKANVNNYVHHFNKQDHDYAQRFKKKSKIIVSPIEENGQYINHEKTIQNPKSKRLPRQMQFSAIQRELKTRPSYHYENRAHPKISGFYQTKNSMFINRQQERFNQHQQSHKTLQRIRATNTPKTIGHDLRHVYNNNRQELQFNSRGKTNSYQQNELLRHRSNNVINLKRSIDNLYKYGEIRHRNNYQQGDSYDRKQHWHQDKFQQPYHRYANTNEINLLYQGRNRQHKFEERYVVREFEPQDYIQSMNSPRFANLNEEEGQQQNMSMDLKHQSRMQIDLKMSHLPITNQNYFSSPVQKMQSRNLVRDSNIFEASGQPGGFQQQSNLEDKLEKKRKIRQKAAQLLSRVKSQQYLTSRGQMAFLKRH